MSEPSNITPEMAERVLEANWKNVIRRVSTGKTLNATELGLLKARAASNQGTVTTAKDVTDLAEILGVTRQTIHAWLKRKGAPKAQADGSHVVLAWRQFIEANGIKGATQPDSDALKARKLLAEVEDRELRVALKRGIYVPKGDVEAEWHRRMAVLKNLLYAKLTLELPPLCAGQDAIGIQQMNQAALDAALTEAASA
jgi:hypothetical protein